MGKSVIQDTAEVIITNKETGQVVINAEAQVASMSQSLEETPLFGGIGNKKLFVIRTQKELELTTSSAFFDLEYLAMTQGVSVDKEGKATVTKTETATIAEGKVTINGTPKGKVRIIAFDGEQGDATVSSGSITVPEGLAKDGDKVTVTYQEEVTGRKVEIDSEKFSNKFKVEYRTIAYDPETAIVESDIYFIFDEVVPSGSFELSLSNGEAYAPELTFQVLTPRGETSMGRIIEVPRKSTP
ncbi:hypothetical protein [Siminovitchia sp. 179-K 8D1 HS]|uniref:hypothetical protein n=1 Tax=Siminovitchia sp. 179-K 8D1 HS TaxID=3142385 RepID=UPI0039A0F115